MESSIAMDVSIGPWDGGATRLRLASQLYATVFAEAPYAENEADSLRSFQERVPRYAREKRHARLLLAHEGGDLIGLVLGTGASEGDWWYDRVAGALSPENVRRWLGDECFSVSELAVAKDRRGHGVARMLMDAVVRDLPYRTAILGCDAEAIPAQRLYLSLGWTVIADDAVIGGSAPRWIMGRRLDA